ncbi:hypothetical protein GCM10010266_30760 [Streptomyces griseomycini]|uniref:Deoxyribodipyrimidine photolyase n=1 Tax=Streptomyces griseomycini TaxID=66895 RepID=A0A7W7M0N8_9ACTN|nr:deoxyribodipyrimidine photolyase [Streptomyces griseomycini]GGQ05321.1 hypothetical protein GCM10010266_30760 [Streptomyces griseomycini]GGR20621.1 hypothetical protein GCM10015536_27740 [Streptomyces griseomycini]
MTVAVVLFTSDLCPHDHPPLRAALASADEVVPLFVRAPGVHAAGSDAPNRRAFPAGCPAGLDASPRRVRRHPPEHVAPGEGRVPRGART